MLKRRKRMLKEGLVNKNEVKERKGTRTTEKMWATLDYKVHEMMKNKHILICSLQLNKYGTVAAFNLPAIEDDSSSGSIIYTFITLYRR